MNTNDGEKPKAMSEEALDELARLLDAGTRFREAYKHRETTYYADNAAGESSYARDTEAIQEAAAEFKTALDSQVRGTLDKRLEELGLLNKQ